MSDPSSSLNPLGPALPSVSADAERRDTPANPPVVLRVWHDESEPRPASQEADGGDNELEPLSCGGQASASGQETGAEPLDESDDIEAYMQQWLRRVRGEAEPAGTSPALNTAQVPVARGPAVPAAPSPRTVAPFRQSGNLSAGAQPKEPGTRHTPTGSQADPHRQRDPEDWIRSSAAAESPLELRALREVANQSSKAAINHSARCQFRRELFSKVTVALVALSVSAALTLLSPADFSVLTLGASACGLVAGLWSLWIVADWWKYRARRAGQKPRASTTSSKSRK